jgi:hypothetical protein
VQEALAAKLAPLRLIALAPWVAVIVPAPHVPVNPLGVETTRPAGRLSVKAMPFTVTVVLLLVIVKLSEVLPFSGMLAAPNALMIVGGEITETLAFEVFPVPPLVEFTVTLLFFTPPVVAVTLTDKLQVVLDASVEPERLTDEAPAVAVAVPPQVLLRPFGVATTKPAGKLSVKATPFNARLAFGFERSKVSEVFAFRAILTAPKAFVIDGAVATVRFAEAVLPVPSIRRGDITGGVRVIA